MVEEIDLPNLNAALFVTAAFFVCDPQETRMSEAEEEEEEEMVAACPQCDKVARGEEEVKLLFGTRKSGDKVRPQSWCRGCRVKASAIRKRKKPEETKETPE